MTYANTVPTVYVVMFDGSSILKVGYSGAQRWRSFLTRGAALLALVEFTDALNALNFESTLHSAFSAEFPKAFTARHQAQASLGNRGAGWMECYHVTDEAKARAIFEQKKGELQ